MIGSRISPIAWTSICGRLVAPFGINEATLECVRAIASGECGGLGVLFGNIKNVLTSRGPEGNGSAVRFACFLRIFRAASAFACWNWT